MHPVFPIHLLSLLYSLLSSFPYASTAPTDVPSAASFYVQHLPGLHQDDARPLRMYAGHLSSDPDAGVASPTDVTAHLYFFMVKARRTADKERIIFWLNGGPGCSSFDGLMMEVGPWRMDENGGLQTKVGGWEEYATVVFVDQPAGTGFSYAPSNKFDHELPEASGHFVEFLRNFYQVFPEYMDVDAYITGESYAGQYIPYFADAILNSKQLKIPLRGAAIGNGWIDARRQYPAYLDYAVNHGLLEEGTATWKAAKDVTDRCVEELQIYEDVQPVHVNICENVMGAVTAGKNHKIDGVEMCTNIYDVRLEDIDPQCGMNWPPDLKGVYKYLARKDVVHAIHADNVPGEWVECKTRVHAEFTARTSNSSITVLPRVLERIPVMLFVGDQDLICNYVGIENMIQSMTWNGEAGLGKVQTQSWTVGSKPAGTWVTSRNLTYAKVFNASHMVGYDVPDVAHDMILRFMGVNFTAITDGSARIPSSVGDETKPVPVLLDDVPTANAPVSTKTPEQDKAMWEAYYNAGSAALVLLLVGLLVGGFFWWRMRKGRARGLSLSTAEEHIPLNSAAGDEQNGFRDGDANGDGFRSRKGKERAHDLSEEEAIFDVGDDDDDERSPRPR
ncbi:alpha/beta-hydrolase [Daedaleopsis nitida]|nr:alpha/beta-hydrolase [Daedaleopsis nitida]